MRCMQTTQSIQPKKIYSDSFFERFSNIIFYEADLFLWLEEVDNKVSDARLIKPVPYICLQTEFNNFRRRIFLSYDASYFSFYPMEEISFFEGEFESDEVDGCVINTYTYYYQEPCND